MSQITLTPSDVVVIDYHYAAHTKKSDCGDTVDSLSVSTLSTDCAAAICNLDE